MSTLQQIGEEAAVDVLHMPNLIGLATKQAEKMYLLVGSKVPFDHLMQTSAERALTTTDYSYSIADLDPPLCGIVSIRLTISSTSVRRLKRSHVRSFDLLPYSGTGIPARYARWGNTLEFDKKPSSSSYTYRIRYWTRPTIESEPGDTTIESPIEWDELYKWLTVHRLLLHLQRHEEASYLVMPAALPRQASPKKTTLFEVGIIPQLWNDLLTTVSQKENIDESFSVNPIVRPYTNV